MLDLYTRAIIPIPYQRIYIRTYFSTNNYRSCLLLGLPFCFLLVYSYCLVSAGKDLKLPVKELSISDIAANMYDHCYLIISAVPPIPYCLGCLAV